MKLKLDCEDVHALLGAFEDNEIDTVASLQVQIHMDTCSRCRARHAWLQAGERSLDRIKQRVPPPSGDLERRIAALADKDASREKGWRPSMVQLAAMLALAFTLIFLLLPQPGFAGMDARVFVQSHRNVETVDGAPLRITKDPAEAAAWLKTRLPDVQPPRGAPPGYRLTGARITEVAGRPVGLFLYESDDRKISCFVASRDLRLTRGFDQIAMQEAGLTAGRCRGHQIVSWSGPEGAAVVIGDLSDESLLVFASINFEPAAGLL